MGEYENELRRYNLAHNIFDSLFAIWTSKETLKNRSLTTKRRAGVTYRIIMLKIKIARYRRSLGKSGDTMDGINNILGRNHDLITEEMWKLRK